MTVTTTYKAQNYRAQREGMRMVRATYASAPATENVYMWLIRDALDPRYDIQQGRCDTSDLPPNVKVAADKMLGHAFGYVEWPR